MVFCFYQNWFTYFTYIYILYACRFLISSDSLLQAEGSCDKLGEAKNASDSAYHWSQEESSGGKAGITCDQRGDHDKIAAEQRKNSGRHRSDD